VAVALVPGNDAADDVEALVKALEDVVDEELDTVAAVYTCFL